MGSDAASKLLRGCRVGNHVHEACIHSLERRGLRIVNVSGNVLEREGLRTHARHRGVKSAEDTHGFVSNCVRGPCGRTIETSIAKDMPRASLWIFNQLGGSAEPRPHSCARQSANICLFRAERRWAEV